MPELDEPNTASKGISYSALLSRKRKLLEEYEQVVELIRKKPGLEDFQKRVSFQKLQQAAKEGPIIILNCSSFGSHAIIVFANKPPSVLALAPNFHDVASEMHTLYLEARQATKGTNNMSKAFGHKLVVISRQLWHLVVSAVVKELDAAGVPKRSRIWWCPTSYLTILPFHAAGAGKEFLMDSYISSYTPTLKALIDARRPPLPSHLEQYAPHPRLLVVAQTSSNLQNATAELNAVCKLATGSFVKSLIMRGTDVTRESVLKHLQYHSWTHFICHGTLSASPFDSALHLDGGGTLSLNDIIKAQLPDARFAFLAACHTADQIQNVLRDETLHLAGAMQVSGFRSVVGTMWEMADEDGPHVVRGFYKEMLRCDYRTWVARFLWNVLLKTRENQTLLGRLITWFATRAREWLVKGDDGAEDTHTRAARALWTVTRDMRNRGMPMERWVNFVHIGA